MGDERAGWRRRVVRAGAVVAAAVVLCWPAVWVGYPLLCTDSVTYLNSGQRVWGLLLGEQGVSRDGIRSALYGLVLYALDQNASPWPVIAWSALLTAWTLWLTVRSVCGRRTVGVYLVLVAGMSAVTTVGWFVSIVMADILAAVMLLCLYLLVFAWETLGRWERVGVAVVAAWCVTAHPTHLLLAAAVCGFFGLLWLLRWGPMRGRGRALVLASGVVLAGVLAMLAVNARLFGRASLTGPQPPYLMARVLADGVSHEYLREHCAALRWEICKDVDRLPWSSDEFLWADGGIWASATPQQQAALKAEEMPLIVETLRTHPRRQVMRSWRNFTAQLTHAGIEDAGFYNPWMVEHLDGAMPGARERYLRSRGVEQAMPLGLLHGVQETVTGLSAVLVAVLLPWLWRRRDVDAQRLLGLAAAVVFVLLVNALVTGVLSGVYPRYQGRVEWLLPLVAGLMGYRWVRRAQDGSA